MLGIRHEDRADFFFPTISAIGESDGWGKYGLDDPEEAAEHLRDEKRREDRLRRNGHPVARWELTDAWRAEPLVRALRAVGLRPVRPRESGMLTTLWHRPRALRRDPRPTAEKSDPAWNTRGRVMPHARSGFSAKGQARVG